MNVLLDINFFKSCLDRLHSNVRVLSFDIFDTLLIRMLPAERVAELSAENMSRKFNEETALILNSVDIINSRFEFKKKKDKDYFFREAEWTLSEWINDFSTERSIDPDLLCRIGRQSELLAESSSLFMIPNALDFLSIAKKKGLRVIALSDTWLDHHWLIELLEKFGLFFDEIFSSGTMGVSKRRGNLFKKVQMNMGLEAEAFVHFGDNFKADFLRPRLSGWASIWTPRPGHYFTTRKLPFSAGYRKIRNSWKDIAQALDYPPSKKEADPYYKLAYDYLSPLLILFSIVQWRRFKKQGIDVVFYIARDAKAMFDVYNIIAHMLPDSCPRRYIRLSRRAVAIAHPDDLFQNVAPLAGKIGKKKVAEWMSNFTVSPGLRQDILSTAGVGETDDFTEFVRESLRTACHKLLPVIIEEQDAQKRIIKDYLHQQAGDASCRRVGIVDSGWACTTQDSLRSVLNNSELISGMYFGVSAQGHEPDNRNIKYGLLRDDFRKCRHLNPIESTAGVVRMWDTVLREPTGTVLELFRKPDDSVEPLLDDGKIFGNLEYTAADSIRRGIHEGTSARAKGVSLIIKLSEQFTDSDFEIAAGRISRNISTHPRKEIADAIIKLGFDEGAAGGSKGALSGIKGLKNGVAWYPGILASLGLGWMSPILEITAKTVIKKYKCNCMYRND